MKVGKNIKWLCIVALPLLLMLVSNAAHASHSAQKSTSRGFSHDHYFSAFKTLTSTHTLPIDNPLTFSFQIIPKLLKVSHTGKKIKLAASLGHSCRYKNAHILAVFARGRHRFIYSKAMLRVIRTSGLNKAHFKEVEVHLREQLKKARKNIIPFVTVLAAYLQTGAAPVFTVNVDL